MDDSLAVSVATMIIGAILGAVVTPLGNLAVEGWLSRTRRKAGLAVALLFLFMANSVWIIGEVLVLLRWAGSAAGHVAVTLAFLIAALSLVFAYTSLETEPDVTDLGFLQSRSGPFAFFVLGNLFWVLGETAQFLIDAAMWNSTTGRMGLAVRGVLSLPGVVCIAIATMKMFRAIPRIAPLATAASTITPTTDSINTDAP